MVANLRTGACMRVECGLVLCSYFLVAEVWPWSNLRSQLTGICDLHKRAIMAHNGAPFRNWTRLEPFGHSKIHRN